MFVFKFLRNFIFILRMKLRDDKEVMLVMCSWYVFLGIIGNICGVYKGLVEL